MSNNNAITISKNAFTLAVITVLILFVLVILFCKFVPEDYSDPDLPDLGVLKGKGITFIPARDANGELIILAPNGNKLEPCGQVEGGRMTGSCDFENINLNSVEQILILRHTGSRHTCMDIFIGQQIIQVHEADDWHATKHWRSGQKGLGQDTCHNVHTGGSHRFPQ